MACAAPVPSAVEREPAPEPLSEVEQLRLALEDYGDSMMPRLRHPGHGQHPHTVRRADAAINPATRTTNVANVRAVKYDRNGSNSQGREFGGRHVDTNR
jgi:hypothetical protein